MLIICDWRLIVSDFKRDLLKSKKSEKIALDVLAFLGDLDTTGDYAIENVADIEEYWHLGDLLITDRDGLEVFVDVKDDSRIADTRNILCEDKVYYRNTKKKADGFMYSGYNYLAVVSQPEKKIYIIDFAKLQKEYKKGRFIILNYTWQYSEIFLYPLDTAIKKGMIMAEIEYEGDSKEYYPISCKKYYN